MILAAEVVFPLFFMLTTGFVLKKKEMVNDNSLTVMNSIIFRVFMPVMLFLNIYNLEAEQILSYDILKLILLIWVSLLVIIFISIVLFTKTVEDPRKRSVMIQAVFRGNLVLFGVPVATSIYGTAGVTAVVIAGVVPFFNVMAVIILEVYRGGRVDYKKMVMGILKNPLILACVAGVLFVFTNIDLPDLIAGPLDSLGRIATPLAFIVLGATFEFKSLGKNIKYLVTASAGRLILAPAVVFLAAYLLGINNTAFVALIGAVASPAAVSSFTMAKEMGADGELAGQIVVVTSALSILTIFFWVFGLNSLGMI